jgi:hypothetical protein
MIRLPALALVIVLAGCAGGDPHSTISPAYDPASGRLTRLDFDSNRDGRPDMAARMEGATVRVVEIDADHDGLVDRWEYFEPSGRAGGSNGEPSHPSRIERVSRRGTTIVRREGYEAGELAWVREDRDADGRVDRWETYTAGALSTVELDTTGSGRPDRRLRYDRETVYVEPVNNK